MKDRGAIKWSSLMLPEHKQLLKEFYAEQNYIEKPILNQDKCEEINNVLVAALGNNLPVKIKIYHNYSFQMLEGRIEKYNHGEQRIKIVAKGKQEKWIYLNQIIDAEIFTVWD